MIDGIVGGVDTFCSDADSDEINRPDAGLNFLDSKVEFHLSILAIYLFIASMKLYVSIR